VRPESNRAKYAVLRVHVLWTVSHKFKFNVY